MCLELGSWIFKNLFLFNLIKFWYNHQMKNKTLIGKCPFCDDSMVCLEKKIVNGKMTNVFTCSNAKWTTEDRELYELTSDSTCSFRIWGNTLERWGKKSISANEVKELLKNKEIEVTLYSFKAKKKYNKRVILDKEYGLSIVWDWFYLSKL